MVAYSFKSSFIADIETGRKRQTIRMHRKRHARPGEFIQLYYAMRTKSCRKILAPDPLCTLASNIVMQITEPGQGCDIRHIEIDGCALPNTQINDFAESDGFRLTPTLERIGMKPREYMAKFWMTYHPGLSRFDGTLIGWDPEQRADG